jgi:hypothetical protein
MSACAKGKVGCLWSLSSLPCRCMEKWMDSSTHSYPWPIEVSFIFHRKMKTFLGMAINDEKVYYGKL